MNYDAMVHMRYVMRNGEKVLQYRSKIRTAWAAKSFGDGDYHWSDWVDVPLEKC